jgi:hypothetical protein
VSIGRPTLGVLPVLAALNVSQQRTARAGIRER